MVIEMDFIKVLFVVTRQKICNLAPNWSQPAYEIRTTLQRHYFDVLTFWRRPYNVVLTSCAGWKRMGRWIIKFAILRGINRYLCSKIWHDASKTSEGYSKPRLGQAEVKNPGFRMVIFPCMARVWVMFLLKSLFILGHTFISKLGKWLRNFQYGNEKIF